MSRPSIVLALMAASACATHTNTALQEPASLADGKVSYQEFQANNNAVQDSMARLKALEVLTVGALIVDAPEASHNCYGPCEDDATDQAWMQEHAWQMARLQAFTAEAEVLAAEAPLADPTDRHLAIDALNQLKIIEIDGFYQETPPNCYVGACPGDDLRAGVVEALAEHTQGL